MTMALKLSKKGVFHFRLRTIIYGLGIGLPIVTQAATSADGVTVPATANPARIAASLTPPPARPDLTGPMVPAFKPQPISPEAAKITFQLKQINVTGATVFGNQQIANMFQNFIGQKITLADLQRIADSITLKYRNAGYILSKAVIPAQQIKDGVVNIRIVEGYISQVYIQGDPRGSRKLLQEYAEHLKATRPLNIKTLERYALLANDIPGLSVKTVLSSAQIASDELAPSTITTGAAEATFIVEQSTANGYVSYDNRGTRYLGPQEFSAGGAVNSIFRSGDQTGARALVTADTKQLQYFNLYHNTPLGTDGATLNLNSSYTHNNPGYTLEPFDVQGRSTYLSAGVNYPLLRERGKSLFLNTTFDWLNNSTDLDEFNTQLYDDHLRSLRIGATYDQADSWLGLNEVGAQLSQGLKILGASNNDSASTSRPNGKSDYTKVAMNASRLQGLGNNFSVYAATQGQYAFVPLLSSEQFGYGGAVYGQAYDPSEITGDRGVSAKAELRYDIQPNWQILNSLQLFTFYDIGKVWNIGANNGAPNAESGSSAGLGVRTNFTHFFSTSLEVAKPLTRDVATENNRNARVFFSLTLYGDTPASTKTTTAGIVDTPTAASTVNAYKGLDNLNTVTTTVKQQPVPTQAAQPATPAPAAIVDNPPPEPAREAPPQDYEGLTPVSANSHRAAPVKQTNQTLTSAKTTDGFYTIQLLGSRKVEDLQQFANHLNLAQQPQYLQLEKAGQPWYVLTYGQFNSSQAASSAMNTLPMDARHANAWVRRIAAGTPTA